MSNFSNLLGYMGEYSRFINDWPPSDTPNAKFQPKRSKKIKNKRKKGKKRK